MSAMKTIIEMTYSPLVVATGPGNPPVVRVLTSSSVQFCSRTGQQPDLGCHGGFVTRTGHKPAIFWPDWNRTVVPFCSSYYFGHTLAPIKYLSFDHIMTCSVYRLCSSRRSVTSSFHNYDLTDIR
jgi:hypothetical protein